MPINKSTGDAASLPGGQRLRHFKRGTKRNNERTETRREVKERSYRENRGKRNEKWESRREKCRSERGWNRWRERYRGIIICSTLENSSNLTKEIKEKLRDYE